MASASAFMGSTLALVSGLPIMWLALGTLCLSMGALTHSARAMDLSLEIN